jgi:hypothetical protein
LKKEEAMPTPQSDPHRLSETELSSLASLASRLRGVRKTSEHVFLGLPLYSIALGPDLTKGELRGHARGVIAIGDTARGIVAFGGVALGIFAFGGLAFGLIAFGGLALGVALAVGGAAIGAVACGGGAVGLVAIGGAAVGYYAAGGAAYGRYVLDAMQRSPEAIELFSQLGILDGFGPLSRLRR